MKKQLFIFLILICITPYAFPQTAFIKIIGGGNNEVGTSIIQVSDGGYAISGTTESFGTGIANCYTVKLDSIGNLQWTKVIGGGNVSDGLSIVHTNDGGYAVGGYADYIGAGGLDAYVIKLDSIGNLQLTRTIGGNNVDKGYSLIETSDGGYAIGGYTLTFGAGVGSVYIIKLDSNLNLEWTKAIGGSDIDAGQSIIQTIDGGFAVGGYTSSFGAGNNDSYIVKLDSSGNLQWTKTIGGSDEDVCYSIIQTNDNGYALCGYTNSFGAGGSDVYVVKLDSSGNLQWTKTIGGSGDDAGRSIIQTNDGGYVICGNTNSFGAGGMDVYVIKLDNSGNLQWTKTNGGNSTEYGSSIIQTSDGGYAVCGWTYSFGAGGSDVYVIKLDNSGNSCLNSGTGGTAGSGGVTGSGGTSSSGGVANSGGTVTSGGVLTSICSLAIEESGSENEIKFFPCPTKELLQIELSNGGNITDCTIEIYNEYGTRVFKKSFYFTSEKKINLKNISAGIYLVKVFDGEKSYCKKVIVEHD